MKLASLFACACLLVGTGALAGCASDSPQNFGGQDDDAGAVDTTDAATPPVTEDAAPPAVDSAPPSQPDAGNCSTMKCSTDTDCQNACPPVANGIRCCDQGTSACYTAAQSTCPQPQPDAGSQGPY